MSADVMHGNELMEELETMQCIRDTGALLAGDGLTLENNQWGAVSMSVPGKQAVYLPRGPQHKAIAGWSWNWPKMKIDGLDGAVKAYPELYTGRKPWNKASNSPNYPVTVNELLDTDLRLFTDYRIRADGRYNVAAECWITYDAESGENQILGELMFWFQRSDIDPSGRILGTLEGLNVAHQMINGRWPQFVFYDPSRTNTPVTTAEISKALRWLKEHTHLEYPRIADSNYLISIELGTEIWFGSGEFAVDRFELTT